MLRINIDEQFLRFNDNNLLFKIAYTFNKVTVT